MQSTESLYKYFLQSSGICTDSRKAARGQIFFALKGEKFDGNRFVKKALDAGCILAVVDDPEAVRADKCFLVDNCLEALQNLAKHHRDQLNIPILGITGSNGKTTTKELIHSVLSVKYKSIATEGNLNNHIGVPLSLLKIKDAEIAIIEMGANHQGEIDFLCRISKPDYGLITNIGKAHLEGFGSFEGIKKAKSELYRYLNERAGTIFLNGSNKILEELSQLKNLKKIYYIEGISAVCDGFIIDSKEYLKLAIRFFREKKRLELSVNLTGSYNLENILAAACIGSYFKLSPEEIIQGLKAYNSTHNRSQLIKTDKNLIISDAYNANPSSMRESLKNFISLEHDKKIIILGDMLELGSYSAEEHKAILDELRAYDSYSIYLVGKEFGRFNDQFNFNFYESVQQLYEHIVKRPIEDCLILLKGSRGIALEKLIDAL